MAKHRRRPDPCFDAVRDGLFRRTDSCGDASPAGRTPRRLLRSSLYVMPGCMACGQLCARYSLTLTAVPVPPLSPTTGPAGFSHLRICAYPSLDGVETASDLLCVCVKLAVIEKLLAERQ